MPTQLRLPGARRVAAAVCCGLLAVSLGSLVAEPAAAPATAPASQPAASRPASVPKPKPKPEKIEKFDETAILNFFKQFEQEVYKGALLLKEKDPGKYNETMAEYAPEIHRLLDLQKRNRPLFDKTMEDRRLAFRALQLAKELRENDLNAMLKESRQNDLREVVAQQFAVRQQIRQMELEEQAKRIVELQKQLERLKTDLDKREANKDALIKMRVDDLMKKSPKVEW